MLPKLSMVIALLLMLGCSLEQYDYNKLEAFDDLHASVGRYSASIASRKVDWDSLGIVYRARVTEELSEPAYFALVGELLREFRDPHVWLLSPFESMYSIQYLGYASNYEASVAAGYLREIRSHSPTVRFAD